LRERDGDAIVIAKALLEKANKEHGRALRGFSRDALAAIERHAWPGNVRELEHRVNRAVILTEGKLIDAADLGLSQAGDDVADDRLNLRQVRDAAERSALEKGLGRASGNVSKAARMLGVSRPAIYDLMRKHGIKQGN